ncbi:MULTISPECIES: GNAT family N-acetyltransferase [Halomonas]|uniref:GNAT family N-acetyltransferase n=1 Tax=Halomonas casei TaxID=2742613 RepID=A0ABR9F690_9GAMM|nr:MULTISPECIES: GNAT family N-acetyltransferase [Halomonas]MBE0401599.1 GNAT family N-acetyltransferase [Halomonas casei]PCC20602.1 ribosomal-protein-alanine acetyltransferase [Halomonas sp. JB37]
MITELRVDDLALLTALEDQARSGISASQLQAALSCQQTCVLGLWHQKALVGYAIVVQLLFDAELQAIGVLPVCRRQGAGDALMGAVLTTAQGWSSERLLLEVRVGNLSAIRLYQRSGFSEDGRRKGYYPSCPAVEGPAGREDALLLSRVL